MPDNRKKPAANKPAAKTSRGGPSGALWTWLAVGVVVAVVLTIVLIKTTSSTTNQGGSGDGNQTTATIFDDVTNIPETVYNTVGVTSNTIAVTPPKAITGLKPLTYTVDGKVLPGSFYVGAEYCPFCAATRWGMIAALSRFGTFDKLINMTSSSTDYAPNTPTFSFLGTTYTSKYLVFNAYEVADRNRNQLQTVPSKEQAIFTKYQPNGDIPFMDVGNRYAITASVFDPITLGGLTREEIAAGLSDPTNPATQAIVATANYIAASICSTTKSAPASVCTSPGVMAAASAMHIHL